MLRFRNMTDARSTRRSEDAGMTAHQPDFFPEQDPIPFAPRGAGDENSPRASYAGVDHVGALMQQLHRLLDQSIQHVDRAKTTLTSDSVITAAAAAVVERHLASAADDLERMAELVHAAMQGKATPLGSTNLSRARPVTLGEALTHAIDVCKPLATKHGVTCNLAVAPALAGLPSGAMYTVALNAIQNAIEAVARTNAPGTVDIELRPDAAPREAYGRDGRVWCVLDIRDTGAGLPKNIDPKRVFDLGFTTKTNGAGVGLGVARSVVQGMGGTIELLARAQHTPGEVGCLFRVRFPSVTLHTSQYRHIA
jgi:signal transduction histidine kinase